MPRFKKKSIADYEMDLLPDLPKSPKKSPKKSKNKRDKSPLKVYEDIHIGSRLLDIRHEKKKHPPTLNYKKGDRVKIKIDTKTGRLAKLKKPKLTQNVAPNNSSNIDIINSVTQEAPVSEVFHGIIKSISNKDDIIVILFKNIKYEIVAYEKKKKMETDILCSVSKYKIHEVLEKIMGGEKSSNKSKSKGLKKLKKLTNKKKRLSRKLTKNYPFLKK